MINRLRGAIAPTSPDPNIAQRQMVLNIGLLGLAILGFLFGATFFILWILGYTPPTGAIAGLGVLPFFLLSYWLGRKDQLRIAGYIPTTVVFIVMVASLFQVGIGHASTIGMAMVVAAAGILIGAGAASFFVLLSILAYTIAGWAQNAGIITAAILPQSAVLADALGLGFGLALLVILNWLSNREMVRALSVERETSDQLQVQSRELEELVSQRTRVLERRALQLQTTADIAKLTTELPDPEILMSQAVELIRARFGFYHASIFIMDETGNWADLVASTGEAGRKMIARHHRLALGSASIIGWVSANRLPRVALDVEQDPFHFKNPLLPETQSELAVPLLVGQRLLGALDVQSTEPHAFAEDDVRALEAIASEVAVAIDSARIQREMQEQLDRIERSDRIETQAAWGRIARSRSVPIIHLNPKGEIGPLTDEVFPVIEDAIIQDSTVVSPDGRDIAIPIQVRGETIATLAARRSKPSEPWNDEEIALMEAVASQSAQALEGARQRSEERRRVTELEVINRISQAVSQMLPQETLFRIVRRQLIQAIGETDLKICLFDPQEDQLTISYDSRRTAPTQSITEPLGDDLTSVVIRSRQPLLLTDNPAQRAAMLGVSDFGEEIKSWLGVPMLLGDEILGTIILEDYEQDNRFTEDDAALLATVASQVAAGIQNANLLDQVQRTARRERLIHEITSKVRRSPDMKSILKTSTRELGRALNAIRSTVSLGSSESEANDTSDDSEDGLLNSQDTKS
ncbi:MAG: GAF domain-containing protein [Anaerolineales bacterium]|nr:MAG: GAF domain-containing protein [Anaerolineales bacterium]